MDCRYDRLEMSGARKTARLSILMQGLAELSRRHPEHSEWVRGLVKRADETALRVRREDLVVASVGGRR